MVAHQHDTDNETDADWVDKKREANLQRQANPVP